MPRVYDISRPVFPGIPVWPGDRPYERAWTSRLADGASCNVGHIAMSVHTGTHMDAPFHFGDAGATIERLPLEACIGPAVVVPLARLAETRAERVLVRTGGAAAPPGVIEALPPLKLYGVDTASVDPEDSTAFATHRALERRGTVILEGLDLSAVPDGAYQLIALPLRLVGMDGSPARAVLVAP